VLHNWSWDEAKASPSSTVADMLRGRRHAPGEPVTLGPWDVRLFRSDEAQDQGGSGNGSGGGQERPARAGDGAAVVGVRQLRDTVQRVRPAGRTARSLREDRRRRAGTRIHR